MVVVVLVTADEEFDHIEEASESEAIKASDLQQIRQFVSVLECKEDAIKEHRNY